MTLFENMMQPARMCRVTRVPDGSGGQDENCECGCEFRAAVVRDMSSAVSIADRNAETAWYTVTADRELRFGDCFALTGGERCERYHVLSSPQYPPQCATFGFCQVMAERCNE